MKTTPGSAALDSGYSALTEHCAVLEDPKRDRIIVSGEDRRRFVNGLVTCDVREIEPGSGSYGFFTSRRGRILADVVIAAGEGELALDLPTGQGEAIAAHLLAHKVADRVEISGTETSSDLVVAGYRADDQLAQSLGHPMPEAVWGSQRIGDIDVLRERWVGVPCFRLRGSTQDIAAVGKELERAEVVGAGRLAVDAVRVERGIPWCGIDFDEECFPQETGLEDEAVSYSKGCYLGQEIVARIHFRGHVNRQLRGLVTAGGTDFRAGQEVTLGEEVVGRVSTATHSPAVGSWIGLAILHRKAPPGETVAGADGTRAKVVELPFVDAKA